MISPLQAARSSTDKLFALLKADALYERPIAERHRLIFYLGHLEAFDWNLLEAGQFGLPSFNEELDRLFAAGIDPVDGNLPQDRRCDWPSVAAIEHYNTTVRERIDQYVIREAAPTLIQVAAEHRLMHAETLAYLLHALPLSMKQPQQAPTKNVEMKPLQNRDVEIPAGMATLGSDRSSEAFGWDNEFNAHEVRVPSFSMQKYKVTNAQYLAFVNAGGYEVDSLWSRPAWEWIRTEGIRHPRFWKRAGEDWICRTMFEDLPFQPNWPVYVSHAEAEAYTRWTGKVLPTEAQYHRAAFGVPRASEERPYPWGSDFPEAHHGNFDCRQWNPVGVDAHPAGDSAFGISGLVGNGWEWTSTPFAPFPGFRAFDFYQGYSADFFDGKHYVLKGGSPRTAALLLRRSFRNWFQPLYPHIYAGFRCVAN